MKRKWIYGRQAVKCVIWREKGVSVYEEFKKSVAMMMVVVGKNVSVKGSAIYICIK
jgi:hypothetical protein